MDHRYQPIATFDYSSAFSYKTSNFEFEGDGYLGTEGETNGRSKDPIQTFAYGFLVLLSWIFFIITIPFSPFFCIKKINSLQRCIIYRLGHRLPLKGPGYILKLPFIDHLTIIDLFEHRFWIVNTEDQMLTGDGSIITIRPCQATLSVVNAVLTTLQIGDVDVKHCLHLRFANVIRSKHVEDLENKMDYIVRHFEEESNNFLKKWGYAVKLDELPRITVIDRADPINPLKKRFQKLFNQNKDSAESGNLSQDLLNFVSINQNQSILQAVPIASESFTCEELQKLIQVLQAFVIKYQAYLSGYEQLSVEVTAKDENRITRVSYLEYSGGELRSVCQVPSQVQLKIEFRSQSDLEQFFLTQDTKYLKYSFN